MRELTFLGRDRLEWRDVPAPKLENDEQALVRPVAVAACDLDHVILRGLAPFPGEFPLGHEAVGEVLEVGNRVKQFEPGDRVVIPFQISCGSCSFCLRGLTANCSSVQPISTFGLGTAAGDWGGAFSDVLRIPWADHMLVKLPPQVSAADAAGAGDNIAFGYFAVVPQLRRYPEAPVLILGGAGGGSIALYAVQMALSHGASQVDLYDTDPERVNLARELGANATLVDRWPDRLGSYPITVEYTRCGGYPVISEIAQKNAALGCAIRSTEPGGQCTSLSINFNGLAPVPITDMYMKGISFLTGRVHSRQVLPDVLRMIQDGVVVPGRVTTRTAGWEDAPEALLEYPTKLIVERDP